MADFSKQLGLGGTEEKMSSNSAHQEERIQGRPDYFVLDMESISLLANTTSSSNSNNSELGSSEPPQVPMALKLQKALSRKGSQRGERKTAVSTSASDGGGIQQPLIVVTSPVTDGSAGTPDATTLRRKRVASPPWRDPRRVLFFFATLSTVGTLVLLYFTLSMGKMDGGDVDAQ